MIYISIGTGISAGVILNGRLHRGVNGMAGEVGHWVIDPDGELCRCGNRGCLETVAAGWGIARQAELALAEARKAGKLTLLCAAGPLNARTVCQAASCGDPLAQQIVTNAGRWIGRAIYNLLMSYGVDLLAVGGGVSQAGMVFFSPVWQELERMSAESPLVRAMLLGENKVILLPPEAVPAERGVITLARQAVSWRP
jgi:glucokinase